MSQRPQAHLAIHAISVLMIAICLPTLLGAQVVLKWPGVDLATIDAKHLRAYVPFEQRERLEGLIASADQIYARMCRDADFAPTTKLRLLVGDWSDAHMQPDRPLRRRGQRHRRQC